VATDPNKPCKNGHGANRLPNGNCKFCEREKYARYHKENKAKERAYNIEHKRLMRYGITPEQYNAIFCEQQGVCLICKKPQSEMKRKLAVDHSKKTGKIRGLLCGNCNVLIGLCYEDPEVLRNAIRYLNK